VVAVVLGCRKALVITEWNASLPVRTKGLLKCLWSSIFGTSYGQFSVWMHWHLMVTSIDNLSSLMSNVWIESTIFTQWLQVALAQVALAHVVRLSVWSRQKWKFCI